MTPLLELVSVNKKLGDFALEDISFTLESGYIMGLVGSNGAGKTSLMHTILNLYEKDSGSIRINGLSTEEQEREAKDLVGFVLDENLFEENMSVASNGKVFGRLYSKYNHSLFQKFCERFKLPLNQRVGTLSSGMKTLFQLAFALSHDARLFLMDEPAAGLDPHFRKDLIRCMQELVEDGTRSILFSTHITSDLDQVGDYITFLNKGRIFCSQSQESLKERYVLAKGTRRAIENLRCPHIIHREYGDFHSIAMVERTPEDSLEGLTTSVPTLEEVLYHLVKGGWSYDKSDCEPVLAGL